MNGIRHHDSLYVAKNQNNAQSSSQSMGPPRTYPEIPLRLDSSPADTKEFFSDYYADDSAPVNPAMTPHAIAYRQEQLRIASQAAEMNPELTGARPAFSLSKDQKDNLMCRLIPLLFFDGRVYFATVGEISAVRERDRGVILSHRINLPSKENQPPVLCLPSNITFSDFVAKWAPNFAVLYGDPQSRNGTAAPKGAASGVGNMRFSKVAINPDRVVGIFADADMTCVEVVGPTYEDKKNSSGFFSKGDNTGSSNTLNSCTPTTVLKIGTQIGDALRKLRPESFDELVNIVGTRDVGFGKRIA